MPTVLCKFVHDGFLAGDPDTGRTAWAAVSSENWTRAKASPEDAVKVAIDMVTRDEGDKWWKAYPESGMYGAIAKQNADRLAELRDGGFVFHYKPRHGFDE